MKSDMEKYIELYDSFGIELFPKNCVGGGIFETASFSIKIEYYENEKLEGYFGFYTEIFFDKDGNFLGQGIWE